MDKEIMDLLHQIECVEEAKQNANADNIEELEKEQRRLKRLLVKKEWR